LADDNLDRKIEALTASVTELASELHDKQEIPQDRITAIEAEIEVKNAQLNELFEEKRQKAIDAKLADLDDRLKSYNQAQARTKAAAILAGVQDQNRAAAVKAVGQYNENNFLKALVNRRLGDPDAVEFVKAVLGTSDATGQAIVPNNFVAQLVEALTLSNPYRGVFEVVDGVQGAAVDIPYAITGITQALLQGAYGSNKDIRDFQFGQATVTLYQIAQIADIGNQLLRQSNGAAERSARRRLSASIGMTEAAYITNGSGSSQPLGFFPALLAFGDPAGFKTTLSSEPRLATMARGIAAMESRGVARNNLVFAMSPTDYWETAAEGLGTSYAGGWAVEPAAGAAGSPPITSAWGVRLLSDPNWPSAQVGTGLLIDASEVSIFTGQGFRIDVSSEAGTRFDQNVTGFRAEEEFGFNAEPYVRTGRVQKIIGI
jgi:HK97 family phage major capsid protein